MNNRVLKINKIERIDYKLPALWVDMDVETKLLKKSDIKLVEGCVLVKLLNC